jgi:hypothetical protein
MKKRGSYKLTMITAMKKIIFGMSFIKMVFSLCLVRFFFFFFNYVILRDLFFPSLVSQMGF